MEKIEGLLGKNSELKKSKIFAWQDVLRSVSGLFLACFMLLHMLTTGSVVFGERVFEAFIHAAEPGGVWQITNVVAGIVFAIFVLHAFLAVRKFPSNYRAWLAYKAHRIRMRHRETTLWWFQFLSGFALFFLASFHLIGNIFGDQVTVANVASHFARLHLFYFALLFCVVLHASIGMYRLIFKWVSINASVAKRQTIRNQIKFAVLAVWWGFFLFSVFADFKWLSLQ